MKGSLRPKGRGFELRVYAGRDPVTAKQRYVSRYHPGPKRDAEKALRQLATDVDRGKHRKTEGTLAYLLERWYEHASPSWSPKTREVVRTNIDHHIAPALGATPLSKLGAAELDAFYARKGMEGLGPATVRKLHNTIGRALAQAVKWGWLEANVARNASPPKPPKPDIVPPSASQVISLVDAVGKGNGRGLRARPEMATFLRLAASSGARRGELCGLRWPDVDLDGATLTIRRAIVETAGQKWWVKDTKTERARRIGLDGDTVVALTLHLRSTEERARKAGMRLSATGYVFSDQPDGADPWRPTLVTQAFRRLRVEAGVDSRLHDLRHFTATELLSTGEISVRTVAGRLGHARTSTTLDTYAAWMPASDRDAARVMEERLKARTAEPE